MAGVGGYLGLVWERYLPKADVPGRSGRYIVGRMHALAWPGPELY